MSFQTTTGRNPLDLVTEIRTKLRPAVEDMRYAAERQKARIIARTGRGVDFEGRSFTAYSAGYKKRKEKSGRNSGTVDLNWSGRMLKALIPKVPSPNSFTIGIYNDEGTRAKAINDGSGKMPRRHFVGVSREDANLIAKDITESIVSRLKAA